MSDDQPLLEACNLTFGYNGQPVLGNLNFQLWPGQNLGLCGANGSGKTTLFRCLTGLEKCQSGQILLQGRPIKTEKDFSFLRRKVGYSLQNAEDQLIFPTVLEDICFGPLNLGLNQAEAEAEAKEMLGKIGLDGFENRLTHELSGGQQKLVALAAVFVMHPEVLLLDEPFNGLDSHASKLLCAILAEIDCPKILVIHDRALLGSLCQKWLRLENGRLQTDLNEIQKLQK